jgi:esterase/lipase superfamily enzyme
MGNLGPKHGRGRWAPLTPLPRALLYVAPILAIFSQFATVAQEASVKDRIENPAAIYDVYEQDSCNSTYCYQTVCYAAALQPSRPALLGKKEVVQFSSRYNSETQYGCAKVSLPVKKERGVFSFRGFESREGLDVQRRGTEIDIDRVDQLSKRQLETVLKTRLSGRPSLFIYIHGYNNDFNYSLARAAQLGYDMGVIGPVLLFAWPAADKVQNILEAVNNVRRTERPLLDFLTDVARMQVVGKINIIAHSLGAKLLLDAVSNAPSDMDYGRLSRSLGEIVFGAPFIDVDTFHDATRKLVQIVDRITVFCSTDDEAILTANKSFDSELVGSCKGADVLSQYDAQGSTVGYKNDRVRVDVIDITNSVPCSVEVSIRVGRSIQKYISCQHSRFASNPSILQDIALIFGSPGSNAHPMHRGGGICMEII